MVLVGRVIDDEVLSPAVVARNLNNLWLPYEWEIQITYREPEDVFVIRCYFDYELEEILQEGPWSVRGALVAIQRWEWGIIDRHSRFSSVPVWMEIRGLPLEILEEDLIRELAARAGNVLKLDFDEEDVSSLFRPPRVLVEVDAQGALYPGVLLDIPNMENRVAIFRYERIEKLCEKCGFIRHKVDSCNKSHEEIMLGFQDTLNRRGAEPGWTVVFHPETNMYVGSNITSSPTSPACDTVGPPAGESSDESLGGSDGDSSDVKKRVTSEKSKVQGDEEDELSGKKRLCTQPNTNSTAEGGQVGLATSS